MLNEEEREEFVRRLVNHEVNSAIHRLPTPYDLLHFADGVLRNGLSQKIDLETQFQFETFTWEHLEFGPTNKIRNAVLLERCSGSPLLFRSLLDSEPEVLEVFRSELSYGEEPILTELRQNGIYRVVDGMHRTIGAIASGKDNIDGCVIINSSPPKPRAEIHIVNDLIRAFHHNQHPDSAIHLFGALYSLANMYPNINEHLREKIGELPNGNLLCTIIVKALS